MNQPHHGAKLSFKYHRRLQKLIIHPQGDSTPRFLLSLLIICSTTVVVTGTRAATVTNVVRTTSVVTETATVRGVQKRQEPPHPTRRMLLNRAALMDYQIRALVDGQYDNSTQLDALGLQLSSACSCLNIPPPYTTTISYAAPVVVSLTIIHYRPPF